MALANFRLIATPYPAPKSVPNTVNGSGTAVALAALTQQFQIQILTTG
nr:hypothetical protein [Chamaesiphon sp. VAR_48_metabat_403]